MSEIPTYPFTPNNPNNKKGYTGIIQSGESFLQIFCCKVFDEHVRKMDNLIYQQYYFSRSEIARKATNDLLMQGDYDPRWHEEEFMKISASYKFPISQLQLVDETEQINRSKFIRRALSDFFEQDIIYPPAVASTRRLPVAFKLEPSNIEKIRTLCIDRFASFSEFVRFAVWNIRDSEEMDFGEFHWGRGNNGERKLPVSIKFAPSFRKLMDDLVVERGFQDRSKLLRVAVTSFLAIFNR